MVVFLTETLAELLDVLTILILRVDHNTISTSSNVCVTTLKSVLNGLACD